MDCGYWLCLLCGLCWVGLGVVLIVDSFRFG